MQISVQIKVLLCSQIMKQQNDACMVFCGALETCHTGYLQFYFPKPLVNLQHACYLPRGAHKHFFDRDARPRTNFNYPKK